jgi:hypothetical protein
MHSASIFSANKRQMRYSQQRIAQQIERKGTTKFWRG